MKPIVGVTSVPKIAHSGYGDTPHESAPELYLEALVLAGATTVILPVHAEPDERLFSRCDGFLLTGGGDVDPSLYDGEPSERVYGVDDKRDSYEAALVDYAVRNDVPLLAICRGIQILNVALGGTLVVDIPTDLDGALRHLDLEHWTGTAHVVSIARRQHGVQARGRGARGELDAPPRCRHTGRRARGGRLGARRNGGGRRAPGQAVHRGRSSGTRSASVRTTPPSGCSRVS